MVLRRVKEVLKFVLRLIKNRLNYQLFALLKARNSSNHCNSCMIVRAQVQLVAVLISFKVKRLFPSKKNHLSVHTHSTLKNTKFLAPRI